MKKTESARCDFFVDEAGDPTFYDRRGNLIVGNPGCSKIFLMGFVETKSPQIIREAVLSLQKKVIADKFFKSFPSIHRTTVAFHAKDDIPEIRYLFFKLIAGLDFKAQFVVARKKEAIFRSRFNAKETGFYDDLVSRLFENVLHKHSQNYIYFAKRGSRDRQAPLMQALRNGVARFETKWNTAVQTQLNIQAQTPQGEPCLSVVDYMNWAIYRAFTTGDMRYYRVIEEKVRLIVDLYDLAKYPNNWYSRRNPFDTQKITPL